jgi:hypothetical protein
MTERIAMLSFVFIALSACDGGDPDTGRLSQSTTQPLVCEAGWDHPVDCVVHRPDGISEIHAWAGEPFHACGTGQIATPRANTCCNRTDPNRCVSKGARSGVGTDPTASAEVCVGHDESLCRSNQAVCMPQYTSGSYTGCMPKQ